MFRNRSVNVHQFAMIPRADIPRSSFKMEHTHKTTIDAGFLYPLLCQEVLPGDTFNLKMTLFARMSTPLYPIMDNLYVESFFFFVPNRLLWDNWERFNGQQDNPDDSVTFLVPEMVSPVGGYVPLSLQDYMGLPTAGQVDPAATITHAAFHTRAYNFIWNEWFRDENLQDSVVFDKDDGPDLATDYVLLRRGKRHDYFTGCLPWPQKSSGVTLPLGTSAPVKTASAAQVTGAQTGLLFTQTSGAAMSSNLVLNAGPSAGLYGSTAGGTSTANLYPNNLYADLSEATAATINALRTAFQVQRLFERDARGGTRYTEIVRSHFGVVSPDARLQRPEYLGGGLTPVNVSPIAQTSGSGGYTDTPLGNLAAMATVVAQGHGFSQSFTEHGVILGLVSIRADLTYQQGLRRMWSRSTRFDFFWPVFSHLGEQAVLQKEIYATGIPAEDDTVFGYQERWAEYRYFPSQITGLFRSTSTGTIDGWHLAQNFTAPPTLNAQFIEDNPPLERVLAVGAAALGQQFIVDTFFQIRAARPMPLYSVPGLIDHF